MKTHHLLALSLVAACGDVGGNQNSEEVITTVQLTFVAAGGLPIVVEYDDPDGDGGEPGTADPIELAAGTSYTLDVAFINRLGTIPEDITEEVRDEAAEHQVFLTGTAVDGPAAANPGAPLVHAYADMDDGGLPIGLSNTVAASTGTGTLTVTLRHMPPELPPEKSAGAAEAVRTGGFSAIGGSTDAMVDFAVTVP